MRTRVKICGITRAEDALVAAECGVDAIGLVFYARSPRYVALEQARDIVAALPPFVTSVGLFLDASEEAISRVLASVPLDLLQFHGDECPADCGRYGRPYIKAVAMQGGMDYSLYMASYPDAAGFLLDSHASGQAGGTGKVFDWAQIPRQSNKPLILAGGLTPENVAEAIRQVRPFGIDLSSGVESAPGIKDAEKIRKLMNEVRQIDCSE